RAGAPLTMETVQLDGPKAGEVLVEIKATRICHTDEYTRSGGGPEGLFPAILGHAGAVGVVAVGPAVTSVRRGAQVLALYPPARHAETPPGQSLSDAQGKLVTGDPAAAGQGPDAGRHQPLSARRQAAAPLHGLLDLRQLHGAAGDCGCEDPRGRAVRQGLLHR